MPYPLSTLFPYTTLFRSSVPAFISSTNRFNASFWCISWRGSVSESLFFRAFRRRRRRKSLKPYALSAAKGDRRRSRWPHKRLQDRKSTRLNSSHTVISYAVPAFYTLSLHDALPIFGPGLYKLDKSIQRFFLVHQLARLRIGVPLLSRIPTATAEEILEALRSIGSERRPSKESVAAQAASRSEEHTSELQSHSDLVCRTRFLHSFPTRRSSDLRSRPL